METVAHSTHRLVRPLGLLLGVVLAATALASWRVPGGQRSLGADVQVEALQTGAIGITPLHPFLSKPSLLPGKSADGAVTLRNQTGVPMSVRLHAMPSTRDLDSLLRVRVSDARGVLYDGNLGGLRTAGTTPLRLAGGQSDKLNLHASLPSSVRSGFQGRIVDITLQINSARTR
jgi:hypothetical protein